MASDILVNIASSYVMALYLQSNAYSFINWPIGIPVTFEPIEKFSFADKSFSRPGYVDIPIIKMFAQFFSNNPRNVLRYNAAI